MKKEIIPLPLEEISIRAKIPKSKVSQFITTVKKSMLPFSKRIGITENGKKRYFQIERRGIGILNTLFGKFWEYSFFIDDQWQRYSVIVKAEINTKSLQPVFKNKNCLVLRTDSGCETGQLFEDLTCECKDQLNFAMETIAKTGEGMIISIPAQDGRGMGLSFKLATLWIQDVLKLDTVESAALLAPGGVIDVRTYSGVIGILKFFEIPEECQINLATNNPQKAEVFKENSYIISEYTPVVIEPTELTKNHLAAKQTHLGHKNLIKEGEKLGNN